MVLLVGNYRFSKFTTPLTLSASYVPACWSESQQQPQNFRRKKKKKKKKKKEKKKKKKTGKEKKRKNKKRKKNKEKKKKKEKEKEKRRNKKRRRVRNTSLQLATPAAVCLFVRSPARPPVRAPFIRPSDRRPTPAYPSEEKTLRYRIRVFDQRK